MDDGGIGQTGSRSCRLAMINRVVHLIADQLNLARRGEVVQAVEFRIANRCARGVVRTVHQNTLCISFRQSLDLVEIETKPVLLPKTVVASLDPQRFGQRGKWRITWLRQDN